MSPSDDELEQLVRVERDLRAAEERMSAQLLQVADLQRDGRDPSRAEEQLRVVFMSVELLKSHVQFLRQRLHLDLTY